MVKSSRTKLPSTPWGHLPPKMRVLFIHGAQRTAGWLADAFASDSAVDVRLEVAEGVVDGLARLRDEVFDAVLLSHEPPDLDALSFLDVVRTGSRQSQPIVVLGSEPEANLSALCYEAEADSYLCCTATTTRTLIWTVARAVERHQLWEENQRLVGEQRHRLELEHEEASRLLDQQRNLIADLEKICQGDGTQTADGQPEDPDDSQELESLSNRNAQTAQQVARAAGPLPAALVNHYREILRTYVIMGSGNLSGEMNALAELLAAAGVSGQKTLMLHLEVLEELVSGLGRRSARHVMSRADILALEVMLNLAEGYRQRYLDQVRPPKQLELPGFDPAAA